MGDRRRLARIAGADVEVDIAVAQVAETRGMTSGKGAFNRGGLPFSGARNTIRGDPLGGTIDYESGTFARPPKWITDWGMEWLYRLVREPRARFHRYVVHEPPFLWAVLKQKLGIYRNPFA